MNTHAKELDRCHSDVLAMPGRVASLPCTAPLESLADDAFLSMWKLRDHLVRQDRNTAAVDEAIEALQAVCREIVS
jgi:hypothetical protein